MAKPRLFISSTYYDLRQTREDLAQFILSLGYEPIRNEEGNIPYGSQEKLEQYCFKEIQNVDILINIIGGRYGTESATSNWSISNEELRTALKNKKQVYIFIDKNVLSEYETYLCNKSTKGINFRYVDNIKIYQFIEEIKSLSNNNNIKAFETSAEIQNYLKEQLAGLFQSFLANQSRMKDFDLSSRLENATQALEKSVEYLKESNKGNEEGMLKLLKVNHPFIKRLTSLLGLRFDVGIENLSELKSFLEAMSYRFQENNNSEDMDSYVWKLERFDNKSRQLAIRRCVFDSNGQLRNIKISDWDDNWVQYEEKTICDSIPDGFEIVPTDLPF